MVPRLPDRPGRPVVTRSGHDALRQVAEMLRRYDRTFHLVSNHRFVVEGDDGQGEVQCVAHHVSLAAPPEPAGAGDAGPAGTDTVWFIRYHDRYRRAGGRLEVRPPGAPPAVGGGAPGDRARARRRAARPGAERHGVQGAGTGCGGGGPT